MATSPIGLKTLKMREKKNVILDGGQLHADICKRGEKNKAISQSENLSIDTTIYIDIEESNCVS